MPVDYFIKINVCGWSDQSRPIPRMSHPMWQYFCRVTFPSKYIISLPQSLILSLIHWFLLFGGGWDSKAKRVLLGEHSAVTYPPRMDRRTVKWLQQFFGPSWSEDKWQAGPGHMLSLEKGTSKGTVLLHLFAEGNNFRLFSANLNQNFSSCQSL